MFLAARFHCLCFRPLRLHFRWGHSQAHRFRELLEEHQFHRSGRHEIVFHHCLAAHRAESVQYHCRYQLQAQQEAHLQAHRRNQYLHGNQYLLLAQRVNHQ